MLQEHLTIIVMMLKQCNDDEDDDVECVMELCGVGVARALDDNSDGVGGEWSLTMAANTIHFSV